MLQAYEVHYTDRNGKQRIFCTYGRDSFSVKCSAEYLLQPGFTIKKIRPCDDFDW